MDSQTLIGTYPFILTEGSVIERIKREMRYPLDGDIENAGMIYDGEGRALLASIYRGYIDAAKRFDIPVLILTPTWRASEERLTRAGLHGTNVNGDCFEFLAQIRDEYDSYADRILIGGLMGCRGDAYDPSDALEAERARTFHAYQVERLANAGVDLFVASTLPSSCEAVGMASAMGESGLPFILSFIVRANGRLLDGVPLHEATATIDEAVSPQPTFYMLNCVHPDNARSAIAAGDDGTAELRDRLIGLQGNTSRKSPEELEGRAELDADPPERWAEAMLALHIDFGMRILGGCCGTDHRYLELLAARYAERRDMGNRHGKRQSKQTGRGTCADRENGIDPVEIPIDGTLDLHTFRPGEVKDLIPEYLDACRKEGLTQVRIIHGKGTGALRETVHAIIRRLPYVERFRLAGENGGGWGATIVMLKNEKEEVE